MVLSNEMHRIAVMTRKELSRALLQRLYARVWDITSADVSPYRDAAVLLTSPYNPGSYLNALRITEDGMYVLDRHQRCLDPTSETDVTQKLAACWTDTNTRALATVTKRTNRTAPSSLEGREPPKRSCEDSLQDVAVLVGTQRQHQVPLLRPGNQATAAQVEGNFSACGNLLVPNRNRIDSYWV